MPELPEVETTCLGIKPYVEGFRVVDIVIRERRLRWPITHEVDSYLPGSRIMRVYRRAKYLLFEIGDDAMLIMHLGMSGRLCIVPVGTAAEKHDHLDIRMSSECLLRFTDVRRFGAILWNNLGLKHQRLANLGPEPLGEGFFGEYLYRLSRGIRSRSVKQFIMDGSIVVGVGNIYANEALFYSKISPETVCSEVSKQRYDQLVTSIKTVLRKAIALGGTTLKDFLGSDGNRGYFQQELAVYGREGQKCIDCSQLINKKHIAGRSTYFCCGCQY